MTTLSIKDVPEAWADILRQRAAANHRSLQGELMAIIEQAVTGPLSVAEPSAASGPLERSVPLRQGNKTLEQVLAELKSLPQPVPGAKQLSSVRLIRADRDRR